MKSFKMFILKACKPVHLWRKTGKKHFAYLMKGKIEALPRTYDQRPKLDQLQLFFLIFGTSVATAFTYGLLNRPWQRTPIKPPPVYCKPDPPPPKPKCKGVKPKDPCPEEKCVPLKPCDQKKD